MEPLMLLGLAIGIGGVVIGQAIEGGSLGALVQGTAALIVFGGTLGATLVSSTREDLKMAWRLMRSAFRPASGPSAQRIAAEIFEAAQIARKDSLLSLERRIAGFSHPFMQNIFRFMVDGVDPEALRDLFESELDVEEADMLAGAKVWTDAGGFAPTIGIIGAVLGLIHVMNNITDTSKLGSGIAVAFVATIYGVASANLILIPIGNKLKRRARQETQLKAMIIEGAVGIASGLSPLIVQEKLRAYLGPEAPASQRPGPDARKPAIASTDAPANKASA